MTRIASLLLVLTNHALPLFAATPDVSLWKNAGQVSVPQMNIVVARAAVYVFL